VEVAVKLADASVWLPVAPETMSVAEKEVLEELANLRLNP
jgi:hypothetical protein